MPRSNSTNWSVNDQITAARLQDVNEDLDDLYSNGTDRGRVVAAISGTALKIDVAAFAYRVGGAAGTNAGETDVAVADDSTNYVEVDTSGNVQVNAVGWTDGYGRLAVVVCASGAITSITLWKPDVVGGTLGGATALSILDKTADYTITTGDVGKIITNRGSASRVVLTLPAYSQGMNLYIANTAGKELVIRAAAGEVIKRMTISCRGWKSYETNAIIYIYSTYTDQWLVGWHVGGWEPVNSDTPSGTSGGYNCGGDNGGVARNTIGKINFATEAEANIAATLDTARSIMTGISGTLKGYLMGGYTGADSSVISALTYNGETEANIAATLDTPMRSAGAEGCVYGELKGYRIGGLNGATFKRDIDDMDFSDDSSDKIITQLSTGRGSWQGGGWSSERGFEFGGQTSAGVQSDSVGIKFLQEEVYSIVSRLSTNKQLGSAGVQNYNVACYTAGYYTFATEIEKFSVLPESFSVIAATLDTAAYGKGGTTNKSVKGYWAGGNVGGFAQTNIIEDMVFSNDTSATIAATLDMAKLNVAGLSNNF